MNEPKDQTTRLGGIRPHAHDPDERPTREDRRSGGSIFHIPVPVPRFLRSRRERAEAKQQSK